MANVLESRARLQSLALSRFGEEVTINGNQETAIFDDEEGADESGVFRITTLTVTDTLASTLSKGDPVVVRGDNFKIDHIPKTKEPLIDLELKNA